MRITIEIEAADREDAVHELNMVNYHVMDAIKEMGARSHWKKVVSLANKARVISIYK